MLNSLKKAICVILVLTLCFTCAVMISAEDSAKGYTEIYVINPQYADEVTPDDLPEVTTGRRARTSSVTYYTDIDEAAAYLREGMKLRQSAITVYFAADASESLQDIFDGIFYTAMEHTGVPTEGDYLMWIWSGCSAGVEYMYQSGMFYYGITYNMEYDTTAEQEAELTEQIEMLLEELDLEGKSIYEQVRTVYDWMCNNITYDYEHLGDSSYGLKHTAYAALVNKTAVCEGYSALLYRLMLELGIDCRMIIGKGNGGGHAWNIVELNGLYYDLDATWDAPRAQWEMDYDYFLRCDAQFRDHVRDEEYATAEFYDAYPMDSEDYVIPAVEDLLRGDIDLDGAVDADDMTLLARHVARIAPLEDSAALMNGDADRDGDLDADDMTLQARYVAKIITDWDDN